MSVLGGSNWSFIIDIHHIIIADHSLVLEGLPEVPIHYSGFSDWFQKTSERRAELREEHLKFYATRSQDRGIGALQQPTKEINAAPLHRSRGSSSPTTSSFTGTPTSHLSSSALRLCNVTSPCSQTSSVSLPIKTFTNETKTLAEYMGQLKQSPMVCLSHDEVTYDDIVTQAKSSCSGRGYFRHLFALGGMNAWSHSSFISRLKGLVAVPITVLTYKRPPQEIARDFCSKTGERRATEFQDASDLSKPLRVSVRARKKQKVVIQKLHRPDTA
ncbi:hypothetical protein BU15DRAFT_76826 [Melanogaster broomeanus]|nr:hypothetical protein BU15DRAFT_76826 [Melanogaster broomeanus]